MILHRILETFILSVLVAFYQTEGITKFCSFLVLNPIHYFDPFAVISHLFPLTIFFFFFWDGRRRTANTNLHMGTIQAFPACDSWTGSHYFPINITPHLHIKFCQLLYQWIGQYRHPSGSAHTSLSWLCRNLCKLWPRSIRFPVSHKSVQSSTDSRGDAQDKSPSSCELTLYCQPLFSLFQTVINKISLSHNSFIS